MRAPKPYWMLMLLPLLVGADRCKGCKRNTDTAVDTAIKDVTPPSVALAVSGIDPDTAPANKALRATVFGNDFQSGSKVDFSGTAATMVELQSKVSLVVGIPALPPGSYDVTVTNPDGTRATLRRGLTLTDATPKGPACASTTIYFGFDSNTLSSDAKAALDQAAVCLKAAPLEIRIEGHCDERGTTEYNLALGQRRADAVQRYLQSQGVSPAKLKTISYGEEKPAVSGSGDDAWAKNRRGEVVPQE